MAMKSLFLSLSVSHHQGLNAVLIDQSTIALAIVFMLLFLHSISPHRDEKVNKFSKEGKP